MSGLEIALAAPAPGRIDEWAAGVREALGVVQDVWTRHVVETEAPGAFLDELVEAAPRLATPAAATARGAQRDPVDPDRGRGRPAAGETVDDGVGRTAARDVDEPARRARTASPARRRPRVRGLRRRHRRRLNRCAGSRRSRASRDRGGVLGAVVLVERFAAAEPRRDPHDRRQLATRRRVRGEEASDAGEDRAPTPRTLRATACA